ncbi:hypothetical protein H5410_035835 [Solanum commersonii]|uniref:Uncharacterized protein n=1 Tax=Solanum commersonii TaxID=4109 RepID=A0A9J5Y1U4_SOLCO|nr:hypothetical protein H5410_035835 [Solanum commersonii]
MSKSKSDKQIETERINKLLLLDAEMEGVEGKTCRWQSHLYCSRFGLSSKYCVKRCRDEISKVTKGQCIT